MGLEKSPCNEKNQFLHHKSNQNFTVSRMNQEQVCVKTNLEDVSLSVDLSGVDLVEQCHHDETEDKYLRYWSD